MKGRCKSHMVKDILCKEFGYSNLAADIAVSKLEKLDSRLRSIWDKWVETKEMSDISVEGFSLLQLMKDRNLKFPAALFALQWLLDNPAEAKDKLSKETVK